MSGKSGGENNKQLLSFFSSILYYIVIGLLVVLIVIMNNKWNDRKKQYAQLVQQAALEDQAYAIEMQKERDAVEDSLDDANDVSFESI